MKKLFSSLFLIVSFCFCLNPQSSAQSENHPPPLRRVTLYKHGVGYFERQGIISGDQQVTFLFDAAQMNDVLKSIVVLDLSRGPDKGKISAVTFDSTKPIDRRLEEFGISLDSSNSIGLTSLLGQLKGARVEVRSGSIPAIGVVVGIEKRARISGAEKTEMQELVMVSEGGELRSIPFDQIRGIKLLDARLREDLEQYLSILQSTIHKNLRKLTIATSGQGERDLFISYVVEAPIWKTTYRVVLDAKNKPFLQGWALIDNVQDEDWANVSLSLVSGAPISFIQDLQQPRYKQRPVVGLPDDVSITPTTPQAAMSSEIKLVSSGRGGVVEGVVNDQRGAIIAGATVKIRQIGTNSEIITTTDSDGRYRIRGVPQGLYSIAVEARGFSRTNIGGVNVIAGRTTNNNVELRVGSTSETVEITAGAPKMDAAYSVASSSRLADKDSGVDIHIDTQDIGELFEYRIAHPITIKRNSSALIPILQNQIDGETVSLYNKSVREQNPMSALYLTNTTGLTLESGPVTIIENDTYAGEALMDRIKPGEKRFINYAVDLGCRVIVKEDEEDEKAFRVEILNGEFRVHYKQSRSTVYLFNNLTDRAKIIYIEHPSDKDEKWRLVKTPKPVETTEDYYRFKVTATPNSTTQFTVSEELPDVNTFALSNITTSNIEIFVKSNYLTPQMKQAMESMIDLKGRIAQLTRQISERQAEIGTIARDQERMRENLRALGKSDEEKQLVQRYVGKIAQGEDQLERLRAEEKKLIEEKSGLQSQLDERMRKLTMDHKPG